MEEYTLVLESQLGPRQGRLRFAEQDGAITGTLTLLGYDNAVQGTRTGANTLHLCHHLRTLVSDLVCVSDLELGQGQLCGVLHSGGADMCWHGERNTHQHAEEDDDE